MASVDGSKSIYESSDDGSGFECSPCDYEGVKKEAKFYCPQCQDYLCVSCKVTHQKFSSTRKHQLVSGSLMPVKHREHGNLDEPISRSVLCICTVKNITIYCKDHNEALCVDCKTLKHRNCKTLTIEEACADFDAATPDATKEKMNVIKEKFDTLRHSRNADLEILTTKTEEVQGKVEDFKKELMEKIEDLTNTARDDIIQCVREQQESIEQHLNTCSTALNRMELDCRPFEEAMTAGVIPLIFIHNLQLKKTLEHMDSILQDIDNEVKTPSISFEFDETLKIINVQSLGVVRSTSTIPKESRPVIADMKIKSIEKVDVKFPADQNTPEITGSLFLHNGELILCDNFNTSVKVLNVDFTQKEQLKLSSPPWDLCLMESDEIVITKPNTKSLLFMKVIPKLQIASSISLDQSCFGVAVHNGLIYVSFSNGKIRILDRTGEQQKNVYSGFSFQTLYYISVMPTGMVYVSEYSGDNVRVLKDGKEMTNYNKAGIRGPMGMYVDGAENILVCEYNSHNLRFTDAKGQTSKVLLSGTDGLQSPYTVCVRPNDNTLIVGGQAQTLFVCKMVVSKS